MSRSQNQAHSASPENLPEHRIIDEFDEMLEIDDSPAVAPLTEARIVRWSREFQTN
jgi:hypothetical protein